MSSENVKDKRVSKFRYTPSGEADRAIRIDRSDVGASYSIILL